jgi:hypothetical protein
VRHRADDEVGAVAQAKRHEACWKAGLLPDPLIGLGMKRDEVGADGCHLREDGHHAIIGRERRLDRRDRGFIGGEGVAQGRGGRLDGKLDHVFNVKHCFSTLQASRLVSFS